MKSLKLMSLLLSVSILLGSAAMPIYASASDASELSEVSEVTETDVDGDEAAVIEDDSGDATAPDSDSVIIEDVVSLVHVNPLYSDVLSEDEISVTYTAPVMNATVFYDTVEEAGEAIRDNLVARDATIVVGVTFPSYSSENVKAAMYSIMDAAMAHTGEPCEGDYIKWQYARWECNASSKSYGSYSESTFTYTMYYYTTAEQEAEMNEAVPALVDELGLEDYIRDYDAVKAAYDYVCANVTYDYDNLEDDDYKLKYTSYAALMNNTAVCQGYAVLMYRLLLEAGIDVRVITGDGGGPHAWNIVCLEDYYYNFDSTWDAGRTVYSWFLLNTENFTRHTRYEQYDTDDFHAAYPMGEEDYVPSDYLASGDCGDDITWTLDSSGELKLSGSGDMWGYSTSTPAPWSDYIDYIQKITIGDGITSIGRSAFDGCENVQFIDIPDGVTSIGYYAFKNMDSVHTVVIPDSVSYIGGAAFFGCSSLEVAVVPESVETMIIGAFGGCSSEFAIHGVAGSVAEAYAVENELDFYELTDTVNYGTPVLDGALDDAYKSSLALLGLGTADNAYGTKWWGTAQANAYFLYDDDYLYICAHIEDDDVLTKGESFATGSNPYANDNIEFRLSLDGTTDTIKVGIDAYGYACYGLDAHYDRLDYTTIDYAVTYSDTYYVVELAIPCTNPNLNMIEAGKLGVTYQLNDINADGEHVNHTTSFTGEAVKIPVFYELGEKDLNVVASGDCGDSVTWTLTEDGTLRISGTGAMYDFTSSSAQPWHDYKYDITSAVIGEGVTNIGKYAFMHCYYLESVSIPSTVGVIGDFSMCVCERLANISVAADSDYFTDVDGLLLMSKNGKNVYRYACGADITSLTLPDGVDTIKPRAFFMASDLQQVEFPESLVTIGSDAFAYSGISGTVEISSAVTYIGYGAFRACKNLEGIEVDPENLYYANDSEGALFDNTYSILMVYPAGNSSCSEYEISDLVTEVYYNAFERASYLESVVIPSTINELPSRMFQNADALKDVIIESGVVEIGTGVFADCDSLETVTIPLSVDTIGDNIFDFIEDNVTIIGSLGSAAHAYANENGITFDPIQDVVLKATPIVDGMLDQEYMGSLSLYNLGSFENAYGTEWPGTAEALVFATYDDHYLYICACVNDDDVLTKGESFATGSNPYRNDNIEFRLSRNGGSETLKFGIDAYGYACYGLDSHYNVVDYDAIKYATTYTDTSYIVELAIPRSGEDYNLFKDGYIGFSYQLNDIDADANHYNHTTSFFGEAVKQPVFFELDDYEEPEFGDASGDGLINSVDLAGIERYISGWDDYDSGNVILSALDLNSDGRVNFVDAAILARHIAGWEGYETIPLAVGEPLYGFTDVRTTDPYYDAVKYAVDSGLLNGVSETSFAPDGEVTRAMLALILGRYDGCVNEDYYSESHFDDVENGMWYTSYVEWVARNGYLRGTTETTFSPNNDATIIAVITTLARYASFEDGSIDSGKTIDDYADAYEYEGAVDWAIRNGIYLGKNGSMKLNTAATRADVAMMFYNFYLAFAA